MKRSSKAAIVTGAAVLAVGGSMSIAAAVGGDEDASEQETPITGTDLQKASDAALEHTGAGRVTETEVDDEESYYEVEVTLPSGEQTDVQLDKSFNVVGAEIDSEDDADEQGEN